MTTKSKIDLNSVIVLLAVLFFSLPLIYWPGFLEAASLPRYFSIGIFSSLGLILWASLSLKKSLPIVWHHNFLLILAFFIWAAISTSWSPDVGTSLIEISQLAGMITLAFLGMQLINHRGYKSLLIPALLAGAFLAAIIGIGQHFGYNPFDLRRLPNTVPSTFINRNHAAFYFDLIIPLAFAGILLYRNPKYLTISALTMGVGLAFLLVNKSRGSLLALTITVLAFLIMLTTNKPLRILILERLILNAKYLSLVILLPLVIVLIPNSLSPSADQAKWNTNLLEKKVDASTTSRLNAYVNSLPLLLEHPLTGTGYGGFRMGYRPYTTSIRPRPKLQENNVMGALHNDPLQYFVELGLPGGILALLIFFTAIKGSWPGSHPTGKEDKQIMKLGLLLAIFACGIHACVDFPLRLPTSAALFWFYLGSVLGLTINQNHTRTVQPSLNKIFVVFGAVSLLFTLSFYYYYFQGSHSLYIATAKVQKNDCQAAASAIEKSISTFGLNYVTQNRYAQIYTYCNFQPEQKFQAMNRILALDPTNIRARLTRGTLFVQQKNPSDAEKDLLYVVKLLPHRPLAYLSLGDAAVLKHNYPAARHYYLAGLKRDPSNSYAQEMLLKLEQVK